MKRRDFLKLIGVASVAPTVLAVMPKKELTVAMVKEFADDMYIHELRKGTYHMSTMPGMVALEDIPKDKYGWIRCGGIYPESILPYAQNKYDYWTYIPICDCGDATTQIGCTCNEEDMKWEWTHIQC